MGSSRRRLRQCPETCTKPTASQRDKHGCPSHTRPSCAHTLGSLGSFQAAPRRPPLTRHSTSAGRPLCLTPNHTQQVYSQTDVAWLFLRHRAGLHQTGAPSPSAVCVAAVCQPKAGHSRHELPPSKQSLLGCTQAALTHGLPLNTLPPLLHALTWLLTGMPPTTILLGTTPSCQHMRGATRRVDPKLICLMYIYVQKSVCPDMTHVGDHPQHHCRSCRCACTPLQAAAAEGHTTAVEAPLAVGAPAPGQGLGGLGDGVTGSQPAGWHNDRLRAGHLHRWHGTQQNRAAWTICRGWMCCQEPVCAVKEGAPLQHTTTSTQGRATRKLKGTWRVQRILPRPGHAPFCATLWQPPFHATWAAVERFWGVCGELC